MNDLPIDILLQLFDVMVAPILLYGAEVWVYEKNDIAEILHLEFCKYIKLYLLLFADDTVIFAETAAELQSALNAMYLYCETWKLKVNTAKTNVVIFSKSRQSENIDFIYNNEQL